MLSPFSLRFWTRTFTAAMLGLTVGSAAAQQAAPGDELRSVLASLAQEALALRNELPNFECHETVDSGLIVKGKIRSDDRVAGKLRIVRNEKGRMVDRFEITEQNGKPVKAGDTRRPFLVKGIFVGQMSYFLPERQPCFHFTLNQRRLDYTSVQDAMQREPCLHMGAPSGYALLDADGHITHLEHRLTLENARKLNITPFSAHDLVLTELNGKTYALVSRVVNDIPLTAGESTHHVDTRLTGCHLYHAESRLLPGMTQVEEEPESAPPHP